MPANFHLEHIKQKRKKEQFSQKKTNSLWLSVLSAEFVLAAAGSYITKTNSIMDSVWMTTVDFLIFPTNSF